MVYPVDQEAFEEMVADALDSVPDDLAARMENLVITVADRATPAQARNHRGTLLGLYEGVALTRRTPRNYNGAMPDRITIFRLPHCRLANDEAALRDRVRVTVLHEVGHHFGMSDARLHELGWA